ncbi:MAG TPA: glycosyltransferase family 39 protein [Candidatus Dormibacteraeota bacterium]|nr:glycosyltransferase family 39 protein [Candidatus Dormibacteraeota bacterium]
MSVATLEWVTACALAVTTLGTRLAIRTQYLFNWDSIQFALGVRRFDLVAHRPHPPGYLGYILLGRVLTVASGGNAETGLVLLSALAESVAVLLAYAAARQLWGRFAGWSAAILLFTSPLFWFYGGTALSYSLEPAISLAVLWTAHRACRGDGRALLLAALVTGLAGAIRPTDEAFLAVPLMWAAWRAWRSGARRRLVVAAAVLAATSLLWLVPLIAMSGGPARYLLASRELSARASDTSAVWKTGLDGLQLNGSAVLAGVALAVGLFAPLGLTYVLVRRLPGVRRQYQHIARLDRDYVVLTAALLVPTLGVYLLVHIGQLGYILLLLPALLLPAGAVLDGVARAVFAAPRARQLRGVLLATCALANAATFALPQDGLLDQLTRHDTYAGALVAAIHTYDPATTVLLTSAEANGSYRLAQYYLAGYPVVAVGKDKHKHAGEMFSTDGRAPEYDLSRFDHTGRLSLPESTRTVIVLDADAAALVGDRGLLTPVLFGDNWRAWTFQPAGSDHPLTFGASIYLIAGDCPCQGAGRSTPAPVPHRPL